MIIIQVLLIISLIAIGINFMKSRHSSRTKAYKKLLLILSIPAAIVLVTFPEVANDIAKLFGVGRGADLLLYGVTVVVLFQLFNNYIKDREEEKRIVKLVRKLAILEAVAYTDAEGKGKKRKYNS